MLRQIILLLVSFVFIASGCQVIRPPARTVSTPAPSTTSTVVGRAVTPTAAAMPVVSARRPITLTVWLPDALVPSTNLTATSMLPQQINAFVITQPDVRVQVLTKRARGPGGIMDLIQTAALAAPSVVPDVTAVSLTDVPVAAQAGLLRPLTGTLLDDVLSDLFPFAAESCRWDDRWLAIPYAADVEHVAYSSVRVSSPPVTWPQVISGSVPYLFPASASSVLNSDALLVLYTAAGGRWIDANGQPALDVDALTLMLLQLRDAQQAGIVPATVLSINSPDDTWLAFLNAPSQMVNTRASSFLAQRGALTAATAMAMPGYDGPSRLVVRGWALVITSRDATHVPAAAALIKWLLSPENEGAWTRAANLVPARRSAFDHWYPPDRNTAFFRREMERVVLPPSSQITQIIVPAIQKAVADVLRGLVQPGDAAMTAAAGVARTAK